MKTNCPTCYGSPVGECPDCGAKEEEQEEKEEE